MALRARNINHIVAVRRAYRPIAGASIIQTKESDYPFRIIITKHQAEGLVQWLVADVDYANFKDAATAYHGPKSAYVEALHQIWTVARRLLQTPVTETKVRPKRRLL